MTNQQLREIMEAIAAQSDGVLRPEDVVNAARPPDHPLHDRFQWDDSVAAEAYRQDQARMLIRTVTIRVSTTTRQISATYYTRDPRLPANEAGYLSIPRIRSEEELARESIAQEFARVAAALERTRDQAIAVGLTNEARIADALLRHLAEATIASEDAHPEAPRPAAQ